MTRTASLFAVTAAALTIATIHAIAAGNGIRTLTLGLGAATTATLAGAVVADASTARRRSLR